LIDDDDGINFLNKAILSKLDLANEILSFRDPVVALETLKKSYDEGEFPELIFLDINMPLMDGWEFVNAFAEFERKEKKCVIIMLSSSIDPADEQKAESISQIAAFKSKPLTFDMAGAIVQDHFPG
jgi:CheY-like chemotaxis protein